METIEFVRAKRLDQEMDWSPSTRKRKIQKGELAPPTKIGPGISAWTRDYVEDFKKRLLRQSEGGTRDEQLAVDSETGAKA